MSTRQKFIGGAAATGHRIQHWLGAGLQAIETLLAEHPASGQFCHGDGPTIADICLVTQVTPAMTLA